MGEPPSLESFNKKLRDYGLTPHEIEQIFKALRIIYASEATGYWGGIPSGDFDEKNSNAIDILVRLGLIKRTKQIDNKQAYECSSLGNTIASKSYQKLLKENMSKIDSLLNQYPPKIVAFLTQYGIGKIPYGKFEGRAMQRSRENFFELFEDSDISSKLAEIWDGLIMHELAVGCIDNVSTRGGELRDYNIILPPEVVELLQSYPYPDLRVEFERYKIFKVLDEYSAVQNMPKSKLLKLISSLKVKVTEIKKIINELYKLGITTKYLESEPAPFLIRDLERYRNFLYERYLTPIKVSLIEEKTGTLLDEMEMRPEKPFTNLIHVYDMIKDLSGKVLLLDKHFGYEGLNFLKNLDPTKVNKLQILIGKSHLDNKFRNEYKAFRDEMSNIKINVNLRVLNDDNATTIHDRYLIDDSKTYNTPPWNIIHRKFGDIMKIENRESKVKYFTSYWSRASKL